MSIRLKLIIAYFLLIILSLCILVLVMVRSTAMMVSDFSENTFGDNSFKSIATTAINTMVDIEYIQRHEPELFEDESHMEKVESNIQDMGLALFVEMDQQFIYSSHFYPSYAIESFVNTLEFEPGHGPMGEEGNFETADYDDDEHYFMITRYAISNGDLGDYVYIVYQAQSRNAMHWNVYGSLYRFVILIILIILMVMTLFISKTIIKPLKRIEEATIEIKQGNLDFSVSTKQKDEFGRVMNAFDTMRIELKHSIDQQLQVEANRKELIANISHDLKTPITSIKGYVEGIRDGVASDEAKMQQYLEVIHSKAIDMDRLIDDLFLFSKLDLNKVPFDFKKVSAKRFFEDSSDEIRMDAEKNGFILNFTSDIANDAMILVDQQQFKRVIANIINNAVKYSLDKKVIDIHITETKDTLKMRIRDYGKGISQEALGKIFDKFYRADPSRNADVGGSGLGLAIAKQIMDRLDGQISAESTEGEGTTIILSIGKVM